MNKLVFAAALALFAATWTAGSQDQAQPKPGVQDDRTQIRKSLSTMERVEPALRRARLNIVSEAGISGLAPGAKVPQVGEPAPDFELTPLKFYEFQIDKTEITQKNADLLYKPVRLSEFRGQKPVVLIFGSYT